MEPNLPSRLVVLLACCFVNANPFALALTFGTLYVPLLEKFKEDRAKTATVPSLLIGVTLSTGIIWGIVCRKFGLWKVMFVGSVLIPSGYIASFFATSLYQVTVCIGIVSGMGTSIGYVSSQAAVAHTFKGDACSKAIVTLNCATGVGALAYPFLLDFPFHKYGLMGTFLLIGGVNLNNLVVSLIHYINSNKKGNREHRRAIEHSAQRTNDENKCITWNLSVFSHIRAVFVGVLKFHVCVIIVSTGISLGFVNGFLAVTVDIFESKGFSSQEALTSLKVVHACGIIGRLLPELFRLNKRMHPMTILIVCSTLACCGQILFLTSHQVSMMYVGSCLWGTALGGLISGAAVALIHYLPIDLYGAAFGLLCTAIGVISSMTGPLYGWIRDEMKSYVPVIALTTSIHGLAALLCLVAVLIKTTVHDESVIKVRVEVEHM